MGLFLYLDDSHALVRRGPVNGCRPGAAASAGAGGRLPDRRLTGQGVSAPAVDLVMLGNARQKKLIQRYGGPSNWSQSLNCAAIGAGRASIQLHRTAGIRHVAGEPPG
jgi:hypothetical protein